VSTTLEHPDGRVIVEAQPNGCALIHVDLRGQARVVDADPCETRYPVELIELLLEVKGPEWLCDEIARDQSSVSQFWGLLPYIDPVTFHGKRVLDFGCGTGASTAALARLVPGAAVVGVELDADLVAVAHARRRLQGLTNATFLHSPSALDVPDGIGRFDAVCLSGVYEHLLPSERRVLLPKLWDLVVEGGYLFVHETPHRWSPVESHTTGLPLLNYLPRRAALFAARRLSSRVAADATWPDLLRAGVRGGTPARIGDELVGDGAAPVAPVPPARLGLRTTVDLWCRKGGATTPRRVVAATLTALQRVAGVDVVPWLYVAYRKEGSGGPGSGPARRRAPSWTFLRRSGADRLVLCYHAVSDSWPQRYAVPAESLVEQAQHLLRRGYRPATFSEVVSARASEDERLFAMTFDDGYRSILDGALPALDRLGVPGTAFVCTAHAADGSPFGDAGEWAGTGHQHELVTMDWNDLRRLRDAGWEIGSHSRSHASLVGLDDGALADELAGSYEDIERHLGPVCRSIAYPFGHFDARVVAAARRAGFEHGATLFPGAPLASDPLEWPRVAVNRHHTTARFRVKTAPRLRRLRTGGAGAALFDVVMAATGRTPAARPDRVD
jgi:peptidoglycan/xylan/chitin deacetylase (PgdA/CDA1 family)/SAM-dependent methyltransferase